MTTTTKSKFQELLENAGYETYSYSGRAMYGDKCLAADPGDSLGHFISDVIEALDTDEEFAQAAIEAFRGMRTDSMGRGMVCYFPRVEFFSDEEEDESEEDA